MNNYSQVMCIFYKVENFQLLFISFFLEFAYTMVRVHQHKWHILLNIFHLIMFDQSLYQDVVVTDVIQKPPKVINLDKDKKIDIMKKFQDSSAWKLPVKKNRM